MLMKKAQRSYLSYYVYDITCIHVTLVATIAAVADGGGHCNICVHDSCNC